MPQRHVTFFGRMVDELERYFGGLERRARITEPGGCRTRRTECHLVAGRWFLVGVAAALLLLGLAAVRRRDLAIG